VSAVAAPPAPIAARRAVLRGVRHVYGGRVGALGPLDLEIAPGEFVVVVGPSGCGKSTLLSLLAGFITPTEGEVSVGDAPGVVFQQPNLFPWLSVRDNVAFGPRMRGIKRAARRAIADEYLALVGLSEFAGAAPYELSGGMQQRCQIARMLANDPAIMLLDEPFGALDALTREQMQHELHRIWRGSGKTALFITHSVEEAVYLGTRVIVMSPRPGRIVFDEPTPFADGERTRALRADPAFLAFRERVGAQLGLA
jgi:NitT/TauT family transport system ATP-binding protein/taurine transport system ATP-binding protein